MQIIGPALEIISKIAGIVETKVKRKNIERLNELKRLHREEKAKPEEKQSRAYLDNVEFELGLTLKAIQADLELL